MSEPDATAHTASALTELQRDRLWIARQPLRFGPLTIQTTMTVARLQSRGLWVHSPIYPTDALIEQLASLGPIEMVVSPNNHHHKFFASFLRRAPAAIGVANETVMGKLAPHGLHTRPMRRPQDLRLDDFAMIPVGGLPILDETAWFHRSSKTLVLADLLFKIGADNAPLMRFAARALGIADRLAMSRTMRWSIADRQKLRDSVLRILDCPFESIIVAHDQVIAQDARRQFVAAFESVFGSAWRAGAPA